MDRGLTFLERGVFVTITEAEYLQLIGKFPTGYLQRDMYPPIYEGIAKHNEIGRLLCFRFLLDEEVSNGNS